MIRSSGHDAYGFEYPHVLRRLNRSTRPYNFLLCPLIDTVTGYPAG
jgi:hypothetical protein